MEWNKHADSEVIYHVHIANPNESEFQAIVTSKVKL